MVGRPEAFLCRALLAALFLSAGLEASSVTFHLNPEDRALVLVAQHASLLGPPECWSRYGSDNRTFKDMVTMDPSEEGDVKKLKPYDASVLSGLMNGNSFAGGCDGFAIDGNEYDAPDSKCTFVAFPLPESGTFGFNFTRTNGTQPYTCSLQYEVVSSNGTPYMGISAVPFYTTSLKKVTADSSCPAVITKCLEQPGWQMNITSRLTDYSMWMYDYSASSCKKLSSAYGVPVDSWYSVYAEGPYLSVYASPLDIEASPIQGANQLNVTFNDDYGNPSLGLAAYNCSVIFEVDAAFYQQFTGQKVTATPATPVATPSPPPQTCTCPCQCSAPGAKPTAA